MRKKICPLEKEVMEGLKAEKLNLEIEKHVSECSYCKNVVAIHDWMNQYKERSWGDETLKKILPNPDTIWNRVHAKRKPDKTFVKKAMRPMIYPQVFSYIAIIIGVILLLLSNLNKIGTITDSRIIAQILPIFLIPMVIVLISMAFCVLVAAFEKRKKTI
ncbi:MAG: hypothetical protein OEW23_15905 [Candidatus Aminicenantes bacterium]|jgi:hypothetical protein|nr:hypothetical protein [Candidatus Aminicenantes bacterium]